MWIEIKQFEDTQTYAHHKYCHPDMSVEAVMHMCLENESANDITFRRGQWPLSEGTFTISTALDGIYDIHLTDCKDVQFVRLKSKIAGLLFEQELSQSDDASMTNIRIPLGFPSEPTHVFLQYVHEAGMFKSTFIPLVAMQCDTFTIETNPAASATVNLGTVFAGNALRGRMVYETCEFVINRTPFYAKRAICMRENSSGCCVIS